MAPGFQPSHLESTRQVKGGRRERSQVRVSVTSLERLPEDAVELLPPSKCLEG